MNDIDQLFSKAFSEACGIQIEDVLQSVRYRKLYNRARSLFVRFKQNTDQGIALRSGHLTMGQLLNTRPETEALEKAWFISPITKTGIKYRALIQCLGEAIIDEAVKCLPDEAKELAIEWQSASTERQIEIAKNLYLLFSVENREKQGTISTKNWRDGVHKKWEQNRHRYGKILPRVYGKWQPYGHLANCQGKTQMIAAFGKLAKAQVLAINPLIQAGDIMTEWRIEIIKKLYSDIEERIEFPDTDFMDSMVGGMYHELHDRSDISFHVCAALQLADGRWAMVDSHALDWGVFDDVYEIKHAYSLLCKYREVLPGLKITVHDHGLSEKFYKEALERTENLIKRSKDFEKTLGPNPDLYTMVETLEHSEELSFLLQEFQDIENGQKSKLPDHPDARKYAAMMMIMGENIHNPFISVLDVDFAKKRLGIILTAYHCIAINRINNQTRDQGIFTHPVCEVANPEHEIAMSVLNSLSLDTEEYNSEFFLRYSFCQTHLCNILSNAINPEKRKGDRDLAFAAAKVLDNLPFVHELNKRKLSIIRRYT